MIPILFIFPFGNVQIPAPPRAGGKLAYLGCQIIDFSPISLLTDTPKSSPHDPSPSFHPLKGNFLSFSPHLDVHPPPLRAAPSKPAFPGISPLPAAPGSCFGVPASSQPSPGTGKGVGTSRTLQQQQQQQLIPSLGISQGRKSTSPAVLPPPSFFST